MNKSLLLKAQMDITSAMKIIVRGKLSKAPPGPPPRPGLQWKEESKRWIRPKQSGGTAVFPARKKAEQQIWNEVKSSNSYSNAVMNHTDLLAEELADEMEAFDEGTHPNPDKFERTMENLESIARRRAKKEIMSDPKVMRRIEDTMMG